MQPSMPSFSQPHKLIIIRGAASMCSPVVQKDATRKYGVTWTRRTSTQQGTYEGMQSNAGELKSLQLLTKPKTHQRLVIR